GRSPGGSSPVGSSGPVSWPSRPGSTRDGSETLSVADRNESSPRVPGCPCPAAGLWVFAALGLAGVGGGDPDPEVGPGSWVTCSYRRVRGRSHPRPAVCRPTLPSSGRSALCKPNRTRLPGGLTL